MKQEQASMQQPPPPLSESTQEEDPEVQDAESGQMFEYQTFKGTLTADVTSNKRFIVQHFKITVGLLLVMLFLKILPSPLIITIIEQNGSIFTKEVCSGQECNGGDVGYETIIIKKINPLQRELKYFVRLNRKSMQSSRQAFGDRAIQLSHELNWIEIYAYRNNDKYGEVIFQKSGQDTYQILFNDQPLIFIGEVHILNQVSYVIKIYKLIHKYTVKEPIKRLLEQVEDNVTQSSNASISTNITDGNQSSANPQKQVDQKPQQQEKQVEKQISVPLTVELVRYSQFFTGTELLIRYVTFLYILYVRAQTLGCPKIFHYILLATANPLIFTEIAFPNTASNVISNMCSLMYIFYVGIFLYYTHRPLKNPKLDLADRITKLIGVVALYAASIVRQLHLVNQTAVELVQYLLIGAVLVPILKYLWRMYFFRSKTVLHRDALLIILAMYYFILLFFSGYVVEYGWKKISFYLIVQAFGVSLCYLATPHIDPPLPVINEQNLTVPFSPDSKQNPNLNSLQSHHSHPSATHSIQMQEVHPMEDKLSINEYQEYCPHQFLVRII